MKVSESNYAKRKAMQIFDEWVDVTGVVERCTSYYDELSAIIEDAVEIGSMVALGVEFEINDGQLTKHAADGLSAAQKETVRQMIQNALDTGSA